MEGIDEEIYFFADESLVDAKQIHKKLPFHESILKHMKEREKNLPKFWTFIINSFCAKKLIHFL